MPNENIQDWSTTASANANADSGINWIEHMPRADVNNSARAMMAAHAKDRNLRNGSITTTGTVNAQAFLSGLTYTTVPTGLRVLLKIGAALDNTGSTTLNMDSIGAVVIKNRLGQDLKGGELKAGNYIDTVYNGTNWMLWNDPPASSITIIQPPIIVTTPIVSVEFTDLTDEYSEYVAVATDVLSDTQDDSLILRFSSDNGATYEATDYYDIFVQYLQSLGSGNPLLYVLEGTTELALSMILDNSDPIYPCAAEVHFHGIGRPTITQVTWNCTNFHTAAFGLCHVQGAGMHYTETSINAVQFSMLSGGLITEGKFTIYGVK